MKKNLFRKGMSALLAVMMCLSAFIGMGTTTAFAAEAEIDEVVMMSFPRDGDDNYSANWGHEELHYMNGWYAEESKKITVYSIGSWNGNACYCIEPGTQLAIDDVLTERDETYWDNYPSDYNSTISADEIKLFIGRIFQYGYTGTVTTEWRSQNAADADKLAHIMATQTLIWETIVGERDSDFNHVDPGSYDAVKDRVSTDHPLYSQFIAYYNSMAANVQKHSKVPSFFAKSTSKAQEIELAWNGTNYSATLTDTNSVLGNYSFSADDPGIAFSVRGNELTITAATAPTSTVSITATKNGSVRKGVVVWTDGVITPGSGIQDLSTYSAEVNDPVKGYLNISVSLGSAKIVKTSEDGKVGGVSFTITGNGVNKTVTTGANGEITIDNLSPGTYTVTEQSENYYEPQASKTVTVVSGQTATVSFDNILKRGDLTVTKTSEDGLTEGIRFHLYGSSDSGIAVDEYATVDSTGKAYFKDILIGSGYVLEEVDTDLKYIVPDSQDVEIEWAKVTTAEVYNELKRGDLKVIKTSEDNFVEGMKFRLYGTSLSGEYVDVYATTDENGVAIFRDILIGENYTLEESDTAVRYVVPESQEIVIEWNKVTETTVHNTLKKWRAEVSKVDSETGIQAQSDATLEGAVYGVYKDGELIDTYATDKNGYFITDYYPCYENVEWTIREISPSEGYLLDPTVYYPDTDAGLYTVELNTVYLDVYEDIIKGSIAIIKHTDDGSTKIETPEEGAEFEVYLKSAGSYENAKETERDYLVCDENGFAETVELPYGVYTVKQTAGWEGRELLPAFDVFISQDGEVYRYIINNANFESYLKITKTDATTGKVIPCAGTGFQLYDPEGNLITMIFTYPTPTTVDIFYTDENGILVTPEKLEYGKGYKLVEVQSSYGYVLSEEPVYFDITAENSTEENGITVINVTFANEPQMGTITVTKTGEIFSSVVESDGVYSPVYEVKGVAGGVYSIIAAEDIYTPDGTLRYSEGEIVATLTTGQDGTATSEPLYLGKFLLREEQAPDTLVLNTEVIPVELVYAGQEVSITTTSASMYNERQQVEISLAKVLEQDDKFGIGMNGEIASVRFGLYAAEDLTAADGKVIPKDGLLEIAVCDENGNITFKSDIPVGAKLYIKEIATNEQYILSDIAYPVIFEYAGQDVLIVRIAVNNGEEIGNDIIRGTIVGKKIDEDGFSIAGATFGLFHPDTTEFTEETALMVSESNEIGVFGFEDVPYGKWIVKELKAAPAFVLNDTAYEVTVAEHGEIIEITIENRFITGSVTTTKVDAEYPDNKLTGAVFEIYVDVDGNKEYDAETDILVGEMTVSEAGVYVMEGLRYNGYFLYEKTAPEGFLKDDGYHYFEIRNDGETVIVENEAGVGFTNKPKTGEFVLTKSDITDGQLLPGVGFRIRNEAGEIVAEGYTDENGKFRATLRVGKYTYEEFAPLDGYIADTEKYPFEIKEDGEIVKATMTNEKQPAIPDIPQTGDESNIGFWIGLAAVALGGVIATAIVLIKKKKDDENE